MLHKLPDDIVLHPTVDCEDCALQGRRRERGRERVNSCAQSEMLMLMVKSLRRWNIVVHSDFFARHLETKWSGMGCRLLTSSPPSSFLLPCDGPNIKQLVVEPPLPRGCVCSGRHRTHRPIPRQPPVRQRGFMVLHSREQNKLVGVIKVGLGDATWVHYCHQFSRNIMREKGWCSFPSTAPFSRTRFVTARVSIPTVARAE